MDTRKTRNVPARLARLRQRFERWRRTRKARLPIPAPLWVAAVAMAKTFGVNRTADALRLDYYGLKKRVEQQATAAGAGETRGPPRFVELTAPIDCRCECLIELDNIGGAKMRVHLKGFDAPDLAALSQSFWNHQP